MKVYKINDGYTHYIMGEDIVTVTEWYLERYLNDEELDEVEEYGFEIVGLVDSQLDETVVDEDGEEFTLREVMKFYIDNDISVPALICFVN